MRVRGAVVGAPNSRHMVEHTCCYNDDEHQSCNSPPNKRPTPAAHPVSRCVLPLPKHTNTPHTQGEDGGALGGLPGLLPRPRGSKRGGSGGASSSGSGSRRHQQQQHEAVEESSAQQQLPFMPLGPAPDASAGCG